MILTVSPLKYIIKPLRVNIFKDNRFILISGTYKQLVILTD
jgi:hypothetical protein